VLQLRLNRPTRRNALDDALIEALTATLHGVPADGSVRTVLLAGEGPLFCAGADLSMMQDAGRAAWETNVAQARRMGEMLEALNRCPVPTVARVQGGAYGGGLGLVAAVDVAVAAAEARFAFGEVKLGLLPAVVAPYVVAKIGESHARALFVTGERFAAERARLVGLVHVLAPQAQLDVAVAGILGEIASAAPGAAAAARPLIWDVRHRAPEELHDLTAELLARRRAGAEGQEGLAAALERRAPSWSKEL
jgi:methylglutaconyl-CoA hydratase